MNVSASEAGSLVSRHERIIRAHIYAGDLPATKERGSWRIEVDDLARIPGWHLDRARLAQLEERSAASVETMAARIATLERELRDIRTRLRALEGHQPSAPRSDAAAHGRAGDAAPDPAGNGGGAEYGVKQVSAYNANLVQRLGGTFASRSAAGRFLARHGIAEATARSWWKGAAYPTEPADALADALRRAQADPSEWRNAAWRLRLRQCADDPACPCRELLAGD